METWALLGYAKLYPTYMALFIANIWGELNIAIRTPIYGITPIWHIAMETGIEPIRRGRHQSLTHRIVMNVRNMRSEISFIPDLVFAKSTLPNGLLLFSLPRCRMLLFVLGMAVTAKFTFD